jgi:hypothetical protein
MTGYSRQGGGVRVALSSVAAAQAASLPETFCGRSQSTHNMEA